MSLARVLPKKSDLVWHDSGIAEVIGKSVEATRKMIERKQLRSVRKHHGQYVASVSELVAEILGEESA
jgi:hypothetical protein